MSTRHDWPVEENSIVDSANQVEGRSKRTSGNSSLSPLGARNNDIGAADVTNRAWIASATQAKMNFKSEEARGSYFPYIILNEIQTMFSLLAKRSARVLPADLCTDHAHYVKNHRFNGFEKKQNHGGLRRDCFSLLHFGKSQIFWFYVAFQT